MDKYNDDYSWLKLRDRYVSECKNCRWRKCEWNGSIYVVHPISGWWEKARLHYEYHASLICSCSYYVAKGDYEGVDSISA